MPYRNDKRLVTLFDLSDSLIVRATAEVHAMERATRRMHRRIEQSDAVITLCNDLLERTDSARRKPPERADPKDPSPERS